MVGGLQPRLGRFGGNIGKHLPEEKIVLCDKVDGVESSGGWHEENNACSSNE